MSERTQLTYVWFVGSFLRSFFDNLFESIRVSEDSIRYVSIKKKYKYKKKDKVNI